jgi:aminoglycoside/choline kinase family phosphotransferase
VTTNRHRWIAHAEAWIRIAVEANGGQVTGPPELIRWWSLSRMLRVPTDAGNLYFKASARYPLVANESLLVPYLATHVGTAVPPVLASDPVARWMLLEDVGPVLDRHLPLDQKQAMVATIATMQQATIDHVDQLRRLGVADRRPDHLATRIGDLVMSALAMAQMPPPQHTALLRHVDRIADLCSAIATSSIPATLIHGDLHPGNMALHGGALHVFDWAEACITHPFIDMFTIFNEEDVVRRSALRDAYLAPWEDHAPIECLHELWMMAGVVHALHHLESYVSILQHTDTNARDELRGAIPFLLGKARRYLEELD